MKAIINVFEDWESEEILGLNYFTREVYEIKIMFNLK